jgi:hypothetical protein
VTPVRICGVASAHASARSRRSTAAGTKRWRTASIARRSAGARGTGVGGRASVSPGRSARGCGASSWRSGTSAKTSATAASAARIPTTQASRRRRRGEASTAVTGVATL